MSSGTRQYLSEEYANEKDPSDGEIYRKIRQYHFQRDISSESRWWARLRGCRAANLKALLKKPDFTAAFDALLDIPGLLNGMQLTTMHKIFAMKSDEVCCDRHTERFADLLQEILHHLDYIRQFWNELVGGDVASMQKIDEHSVRVLESKAPGSSSHDAEDIRWQLVAGKIFGAFNDNERSEILARLSRFQSLIPTLNTFFRDLVFWEALTGSMRYLISLSRHDTLLSGLESSFTEVNQHEDRVILQMDEVNFTTAPGTLDNQISLGYRHLWAFAMRYFMDLPPEPNKKCVSIRPRARTNKAVLNHFARLSVRLGFETPCISDILKNSDSLGLQSERVSDTPILVASGPGEKLENRCGIPRLAEFDENRAYLFPRYLDDDSDESGEGITSFFVLKAIYQAFLGRSEANMARLMSSSELNHGLGNAVTGHPKATNGAMQQQPRREEEGVGQGGTQAREEEERRAREEEERRAQEEEEQRQRTQLMEVQAQGKMQEQPEPGSATQGQVCVHFKIRENNVWRHVQDLWIRPSDTSEVVRISKKNMRKGLRLFDTNMQCLAPENAFECVTKDGTNTIMMIPQRELNVDNRALDSANVMGYEAIVEGERLKRRTRYSVT